MKSREPDRIARDAGWLLRIPIDRKSLEVITAESLRAIEGKTAQRVFACANPHSLVIGQNDLAFREALTHADFVVSDGVGVSWMARVAGIEIGPRITGAAYFFSLLTALQTRGHGRVFFFGSTPAVLECVASRFRVEFPSLMLCGTLSPPFGPWGEEYDRRMVERINATRPDVLWVGMTAPKQERWVEANRGRLSAPLIGSIGAVFDFYARTHPRAPGWLCRMGLEWAYRFAREPRRMWRRNLVSAPQFIWLVLRRHGMSFGKSGRRAA